MVHHADNQAQCYLKHRIHHKTIDLTEVLSQAFWNINDLWKHPPMPFSLGTLPSSSLSPVYQPFYPTFLCTHSDWVRPTRLCDQAYRLSQQAIVPVFQTPYPATWWAWIMTDWPWPSGLWRNILSFQFMEKTTHKMFLFHAKLCTLHHPFAYKLQYLSAGNTEKVNIVNLPILWHCNNTKQAENLQTSPLNVDAF